MRREAPADGTLRVEGLGLALSESSHGTLQHVKVLCVVVVVFWVEAANPCFPQEG